MDRATLRILVQITAVLSLTGLPYLVLGLWNRVFGGWDRVFFCYAGSDRFAKAYGVRALVRVWRWIPSPIGVLEQDGKRGLVLASPATEADFADPANAENLMRLLHRIGWIARLTGMRQVHLAGILPSRLRGQTALALADTQGATVRVVVQAAEETIAQHLPAGTRRIIVLGGAGFIGRPVVAALRARGYECRSVDPRHGTKALPDDWRGAPALLLDIARAKALQAHAADLWPGIVVLNEVFPPPSRRLVAGLQARGIPVLHLSGVAGRVRPPLPHGYEGAVPCCAARLTDAPPAVVIQALAPPVAAP